MADLGTGPSMWRKSTRCESHACVEVARSNDQAAIRNSDLPDEHLSFDGRAWGAFIAGVRRGEFDAR